MTTCGIGCGSEYDTTLGGTDVSNNGDGEKNVYNTVTFSF